jgi:hypothetical protein
VSCRRWNSKCWVGKPNPELIVGDKPVSSLDVLIQAQVLNLFEQLRRERGVSYLFISHDHALVRQVSDRVAVMHLGQLVEIGPVEAVYRRPLHPVPRFRRGGCSPAQLAKRRPGVGNAPPHNVFAEVLAFCHTYDGHPLSLRVPTRTVNRLPSATGIAISGQGRRGPFGPFREPHLGSRTFAPFVRRPGALAVARR